MYNKYFIKNTNSNVILQVYVYYTQVPHDIHTRVYMLVYVQTTFTYMCVHTYIYILHTYYMYIHTCMYMYVHMLPTCNSMLMLTAVPGYQVLYGSTTNNRTSLPPLYHLCYSSPAPRSISPQHTHNSSGVVLHQYLHSLP